MEVETRSDSGPKKGVGAFLGSLFGLSRCPDLAIPSLTGPLLCPDWPFPRPSGPPRRKPSSGENPWRSCCCTNVSGGRLPVPLPALSHPLSCRPLPGQSATGPGEAAIPSLLGIAKCPCYWERLSLGRGPWSGLGAGFCQPLPVHGSWHCLLEAVGTCVLIPLFPE